MADGVTFEVEGLKELQEKLRALGPKVARNALRSAVNAGAQVVRKEVQARAPIDTGTLRRAIYIKQIRELSNEFQQTFYIGVRRGKKYQKKKMDAWYAMMVEFGTSKMPAKPYIRPAFESKKVEAAARIKEKLMERIEKMAAMK